MSIALINRAILIALGTSQRLRRSSCLIPSYRSVSFSNHCYPIMPTDTVKTPAYRLLKPLVDNQDATKCDAGSFDVTKVVSELSDAARAAEAAENNLEDFVYDTWAEFFKIVAQIEYSSAAQDELVKVLRELRGTSVTGSGGKTLVVNEAGEIWKDLPTFGWMARDLWNFDIRDPDNKPEDINKFNNQTAFLARLTSLAYSKGDTNSPLDYSLYALWSFRDAFEQSSQSLAAAKNSAIWINYASNALKGLASKGHDFPDRSGTAGPEYSSKEWKGFNQERWEVWRRGFQNAIQQVGAEADQDTRGLLKKAVDLM
ncbi:hypothetical protein PpBr36_04087 [Pyricularia pennisetigena]|uniref:hypothetical protein n=1 Tax=Pyricularia pennisetigena TaxID=1578925 RepID=UPI001154777E|nr:hypothetical protein PpBr36_04087 [Pyricularia pennisetigena]TLS27325.1 hypothetical protein PpBr36_04087 [Pyricularia pennisetigena]